MKNIIVFSMLLFVAVPQLPGTLSAEVPSADSSYLEATSQIKTPKELSKFLKKNFDFVFDEDLFSTTDYWQSPEEFWENKKGDCEDYAVFSKAVLENLGFKATIISLYGPDGYAHTVTVFEDEIGFNVMNEDRLYRYGASSIEEAVSKIFPDWTWAGIARLQGTRGWMIRELHNPALLTS